LFLGTPLDALPLVRRKLCEPFLKEPNVEKGDGERADTAMGTARSAGDLAQECGLGPYKPLICLSSQ
jgi:hypothetical protein